MIADAFLWVLNRMPALRRTLWRMFFGLLATRFGNVGWWTLMNYGYADLDCSTKALALEPADDAERYPIALYHHVATLAPVAGCEVLEVGSGRGGGASFVARYLSPARMVGIDLSSQAQQVVSDAALDVRFATYAPQQGYLVIDHASGSPQLLQIDAPRAAARRLRDQVDHWRAECARFAMQTAEERARNRRLRQANEQLRRQVASRS